MNQVTYREIWPNSGSLMQDKDGNWQPVPDLMTEEELIRYLRIPEISKSQDYHNVIANLMRMRDLPCVHISRQPLYPLHSIREWMCKQIKSK